MIASIGVAAATEGTVVPKTGARQAAANRLTIRTPATSEALAPARPPAIQGGLCDFGCVMFILLAFRIGHTAVDSPPMPRVLLCEPIERDEPQ